MTRSPRTSPFGLATACLSALLLCVACGDASQVDDARHQFQIGNLDTAEAFLEGASSAAAEGLRAEIASAREAREQLAVQLVELAALAPEDEQVELKALLKGTRDPIARDSIERALSSSADRRAEERVARGNTPIHPFGDRLTDAERAALGAPGEPLEHVEVARETKVDAAGLEAARAAVRARIDGGQWAEALAEIEMALPVAGLRADEFRELRRDVQDRALGEALALLAQAEEADDQGRLEDARDLLREAAPRFPHSGGGASLRDALEDYQGRLEILALADSSTGADHSATAFQPFPEGSIPELTTDETGDPLQRAMALERGGDLAGALDAYLEAGFAALPGAERDGLIARARGVERRLLLRTEILAARAISPAEFEELGLVGGDETLLRLAGGPSSWDAWPLEKLKRAATRSTLSQEAQLGLLDERLRRGDTGGRSGALATLARFVKDGVIEEVAAWELVAAQREESVPEGGYVWERGAWISAQDKLDAEASALLASLEKQFSKGKTRADRQEAWDALAELGPAALATRTSLLEARWEKALLAVRKGSTLSSLERIAQDREELDHRRAEALELIFDEEEYFYPYRPPECPPEKARLYWPVQQRVDQLVAAVREVWDAAKPVKLSSGFRDGLADLSWALERGQEVGLALAAPEDFPTWIWSVPVELEAVGLREFAWTEGERQELAYNRAVEAYDERTWADSRDLSEDEAPDHSEQRQVEITNEYRKMFGRRALAWNPKIQVAADMHSDYMADTGDFGHFEQGDPERRSPFDRMRLAGYNYGASENCHMGSGSPEGAHNGWVHSSGHHRNILMPGHREMASAMTGSYWTQNFGTGTAFKAALDSWQD